MSKIKDTLAEFPGITIIHQKIPGREVGRHQHDEHEFFLPLQGEISVQFGDETVKAGPGRMLYVPPDLDHSFSSSAQGSGERVIWLISPKLWKKQIAEPFKPCSLAMNSLAKELVFYLLINQQAAGAKYFISALIESLGDSLQGAQLEKQRLFSNHIAGKIEDVRVAKSLQIIDEELDSISLADISKRSGLSLRNFNRLFLQEAGLPPKDYIILRRIEKAKELLSGSKMTVTDIALEVGYNSLSKFIGTFKKVTGQLPSDYRHKF